MINLRVHHLYAAKISINENLFTKPLFQVKPFFLQGIKTSGIFLMEYNSLWNFLDIEKLDIEGRTVLAGRLCRGKDEFTRVIDIENIKIKKDKKDKKDNVASWSNFLFDYETEIVIFEERRGRISRYQFMDLFKRLISINAPELGLLEYQFIPAAENIRLEIDKFSKIYYARFEIIPANWDDDEDFNDFDEALKDLGTNKASQVYESKNGLNKNAKLFKKPVNMALAGYGKFNFSGTDKEGDHKQLDSSKELFYRTVYSDEEVISEMAHEYFSFLEKAIEQHLGESKHE